MDKFWIFVILYCLALTYLSLNVRRKKSKIFMWYIIFTGCSIGPWIIIELSIAVGFSERVTDPFYYIGYISAAIVLLIITSSSILFWDLLIAKYIIGKRDRD